MMLHGSYDVEVGGGEGQRSRSISPERLLQEYVMQQAMKCRGSDENSDTDISWASHSS
jgi:hypothetical protein